MSSSLHVLQYTEQNRIDILKCYERTPENLYRDIENVKEWFAKQSHIPEIPNDKMIENFLILNKFHVELAKKRLEMYYCIRTIFPDFFNQNPNGSITQTLMNVMYVIPLPKLSKGLYRVVIAAKLKSPDLTNLDVMHYLAHSYNVIEMRLRFDCSLATIHIFDLANMKVSHLAKFTPSLIQKVTFITENVLSNRMAAIHLLNPPSFLDSFMSLLKKYLKPKIANRIYMHKTIDTILETIGKEVLPKDFGGDEKSLEELNEKWRKTFLQYDSLYKHLQELKVDEALQPSKLLAGNIIGLEGNFRRLDID